MVHAVSSTNLIRQHRLELSKAFERDGSCDARRKALSILNDYLDYLERELSDDNASIDVSQVQEMLLEVSCIVRSGCSKIQAEHYGRILQRLIGIYAKGLNHAQKDAFSITAADYAEVIEAISVKYPGYDYSEAVGQLVLYMNRLFELRKGSWKTVYEHILSMPDSIQAIQLLKQDHFEEIRVWAEEGVHNLFALRKDLFKRMDELERESEQVDELIEDLERSRDSEQPFERASNVISFQGRLFDKEIAGLRQDRAALAGEILGQEHLIQLIEENIAEFEDKLNQARRAFFVRLVYDAESGAGMAEAV